MDAFPHRWLQLSGPLVRKYRLTGHAGPMKNDTGISAIAYSSALGSRGVRSLPSLPRLFLPACFKVSARLGLTRYFLDGGMESFQHRFNYYLSVFAWTAAASRCTGIYHQITRCFPHSSTNELNRNSPTSFPSCVFRGVLYYCLERFSGRKTVSWPLELRQISLSRIGLLLAARSLPGRHICAVVFWRIYTIWTSLFILQTIQSTVALFIGCSPCAEWHAEATAIVLLLDLVSDFVSLRALLGRLSSR